MDKIIKILMKRDGLTEHEARQLCKETREAMDEADGMDEAESIFEDMIGLEPDYLVGFLLG